MIQNEKQAIFNEVQATSIADLQPPMDESTLLHELVAQFLAHDGYVETARAFAHEAGEQIAPLNEGATSRKYDVEDDLEATNRQSEFDLIFPYDTP